METYDLLQVAGREWRTLCHSSDFAAKEKSLLDGTGSCGGIITAPYGGSQRSEEHSNCALSGQLQVYKHNGGSALPKDPLGLGLKIGVGRGARPSLIKARGQGHAPFCVHLNGPTAAADLTAEDV